MCRLGLSLQKQGIYLCLDSNFDVKIYGVARHCGRNMTLQLVGVKPRWKYDILTKSKSTLTGSKMLQLVEVTPSLE